jgi:uncharacterized protein (DUF58 family)
VSEELLTAQDRARLQRLALRPRRRLPGDAPGGWRTGRVGTGVLFADHRPYVTGDDPRYVDWHVAARLGDWVVKRFESEENLDLCVCVDRSLSMLGRKGLLARRLAAALGLLALDRHDRVRVAWLPGPTAARTEVFEGPGAPAALLLALGAAPPGGTTQLRHDLGGIRDVRRRKSLLLVLSDFLDPVDPVGGLEALASRGHEVVALHLMDPADVDLPLGAAVRAVDVETGEPVDVDVTPALLAELRLGWWRRAAALARACRAAGAAYESVDAAQGLWPALLRLLARGAVGRA